MFTMYLGDDLIGLPCNNQHLVVRWNCGKGVKILISFTQKGEDVFSCHYANKGGTYKQSDDAIDNFPKFVAEHFPDIKKLVALVTLPKVGNKITKLGWVSQGFTYSKENGKKIEVFEKVVK